MVDLLIGTLEKMGYPVKRQGSLLENEPYPESFFTFWNDDTTGQSHYNNEENVILWEYSVNFYSSNTKSVNTKLLEAKKLLTEAGFTVSGAGYDVASDEITHTGRGISVYYAQRTQEGQEE